MLKIALLNDSSQLIGGGFSFIRNLKKGLEGKVEFTSLEKCDIGFITSASMITKETAQKAIDLKKKLVLRIDNVPRNSRNRNTGTTRIKKYAEVATAVVYQSEWARGYLSRFLGRDGRVVYNGIDPNIFSIQGRRVDFSEGKYRPIYIYSRFNRDETKHWEVAWYRFQMIARKNPLAKLVIAGRFSQEQIECNFDFFMGEHVQYVGVIDDQEKMAKIYRGCTYFLATYFNDAYSHAYQEAMACGVELLDPDMSGGTAELVANGSRSLFDMAKEYLEVFEEVMKL